MITKRMRHLDGRGRGVLIVDSDRSLRLVLSRALRNINFEVVLAENGAEGLKAVTSPDEAFDLIVLDLMVPRLDDGYKFIEQVRIHNPGQDPHIIVFTAASRMEVEKIPSNSVCAVVLKPLDLYRVIDIIGNCAKGAHATMRAEFVEGAADAPVRGWGFRKFILVVEDDLKLGGYYRELFEPYGATVEYVSTAAAAREYLPRMDLLIVEVTREAVALLEELRCEHPSLLGRTLIVTSSSLGPQVFGDVPVLEKPFGVTELFDIAALIATYPIERSLGREWKAPRPKPSTPYPREEARPAHDSKPRRQSKRNATQQSAAHGRIGFARLDPARMREIAAKGGIAAHAKGRAHEFTSETAAIAGRKGGEKISRDRAHMSAIGREGGHARAGRKPSARVEPRPRRKGR